MRYSCGCFDFINIKTSNSKLVSAINTLEGSCNLSYTRNVYTKSHSTSQSETIRANQWGCFIFLRNYCGEAAGGNSRAVITWKVNHCLLHNVITLLSCAYHLHNVVLTLFSSVWSLSQVYRYRREVRELVKNLSHTHTSSVGLSTMIKYQISPIKKIPQYLDHFQEMLKVAQILT
jgi:hypothetical protein